jgi:hypothetical protein
LINDASKLEALGPSKILYPGGEDKIKKNYQSSMGAFSGTQFDE